MENDTNTPISDKELVRKAQKGDKNAQEELVERYYKSIFGYIYLRIRNYYISEDLTQEVFLRVFRSLKKYTASEGFANWIYTIAYNCCQEWLRKQQKLKILPEDILSLQHPQIHQNIIESNEQLEILRQRLKELPELYYQVLSMKYMQKMSCKEIARVLDQPVGNITSILSRAYKLLREEIKKDEVK